MGPTPGVIDRRHSAGQCPRLAPWDCSRRPSRSRPAKERRAKKAEKEGRQTACQRHEAKYEAKERRAEQRAEEWEAKRTCAAASARPPGPTVANCARPSVPLHESRAAIAEAVRTAEIEAARSLKKPTPQNARRADMSIAKGRRTRPGLRWYRGSVVAREKIGDLQAARGRTAGDAAPVHREGRPCCSDRDHAPLVVQPDPYRYGCRGRGLRPGHVRAPGQPVSGRRRGRIDEPEGRRNAYRAIGNELTLSTPDILPPARSRRAG